MKLHDSGLQVTEADTSQTNPTGQVLKLDRRTNPTEITDMLSVGRKFSSVDDNGQRDLLVVDVGILVEDGDVDECGLPHDIEGREFVFSRQNTPQLDKSVLTWSEWDYARYIDSITALWVAALGVGQWLG